MSEAAHIYRRRLDLSAANDSLAMVASHIPQSSWVLELGAATGYFAHALSQEKGCRVDGVELDPVMAREARPWYRRLVVGDLDRLALTDYFPPGGYDTVVCADVLEHLRSPETLLRQLPALLTAGGQVLVVVPNAGYAGIIAELMQGDFRYRPEGLLDRTHLRFYTRRSLIRMCEDCGFSVVSVATTLRHFEHSEFADAVAQLPEPVLKHLAGLADADAYQFVARLQPSRREAAPRQGPWRKLRRALRVRFP